MIRSMMVILTLALAGTAGQAQTNRTVTSTPNIFGGQNYSNGTSSRSNIFGGQDFSKPNGGSSFSTMPNIFGGFNFSNGGSSRSNIFGGQDYSFPRNR